MARQLLKLGDAVVPAGQAQSNAVVVQLPAGDVAAMSVVTPAELEGTAYAVSGDGKVLMHRGSRVDLAADSVVDIPLYAIPSVAVRTTVSQTAPRTFQVWVWLEM